MLEKINFTYTVADEQNGLFTSYHTKFDCMIKYNGKQFKFPYQCNTSHIQPNLRDCIECLLLDASAYDNATSEVDFAYEFGYDFYEDRKRVTEIYNACEKTYKALHRLFTNEELTKLEEEIAE